MTASDPVVGTIKTPVAQPLHHPRQFLGQGCKNEKEKVENKKKQNGT